MALKKLLASVGIGALLTTGALAQSGPNGGIAGPHGNGQYSATPNGGLSLTSNAFSLGDGVGITYTSLGVLSLFSSTQPTGDGADYTSQNSTTTAASIYAGLVPGTYHYWDGVRSVVDQESGATTTNMSGFGAYCYNNLALAGGANNHACVGYFAVMADVANGSTVWGENYTFIDSTTTAVSAGTGKTEIGSEYDFTTTSPNTVVSAVALELQGLSKPAAASGFQVSVNTTTATLSGVAISNGSGGAGTSVTGTVVSGTVANGNTIEGGTITANTVLSGVSVVAGALTATASVSQNTTATAGVSLNPPQWGNAFTVNAGSSTVGAFYGAANVSGFSASSVPIEFGIRDSAGAGHILTVKGAPVGASPAILMADTVNVDGLIFEPGAPASGNVFLFPGGAGSDAAINLNLLAKSGTIIMGSDVLPSANGGEALGNASHLWSSVDTQQLLYGLLYSAAGTALPSCAAGTKGIVAMVSDATAPTYHGTYTSGGAVVSPVYCNGSNWLTS